MPVKTRHEPDATEKCNGKCWGKWVSPDCPKHAHPQEEDKCQS